MEENKEEKKMKTWPITLAVIVLVFMMGSLLLGKISNNFYGSLSSDKKVSVPEINSTSENVNLEDVFNQIMSEESDSDSEEISFETVDLSGLGPTESYLVIKEEIKKVENLDELIYFVRAYGSEKNVSAVQQLYKVRELIDEDQIMSLMFSGLDETVKSAELLNQEESEATIKAIFESGKEIQAKMVMEDGVWKLDAEG